MSASSEIVPPSLGGGPNQIALTKKLLVAWGCGLLYGWGVFLPVVFIMAAVVAAVGSFGSFDASNWISLFAVLGLGTMFPGLMLLGAYVTRSWRRGITSGLAALLASVIGLLTGWVLASFLPYWALEEWTRVAGDILLAPGMGGGAAIATITLMSGKALPHRGLGFGLVIGLVLSVGSGLVLGGNLLAQDNSFHFLWQIPPLVWVSAVYVPELKVGRSGLMGFVVWLLLILITFGLPFVVVPLFS